MPSRTFATRSVLPFLFLVIAITGGQAAYLHVPADYPTIQAAIDAAHDGDEVLLAEGMYHGPGNRDISFRGKAITVRSHNNIPSGHTIECVGTPQNPHRAFIFDGEGPGSVLARLNITTGYADLGGAILMTNSSARLDGININYSSATIQGGGIFIAGGAPTLNAVTFLDCDAPEGGGLYITECDDPVTLDMGGFFWCNASYGGAIYVATGADLRIVGGGYAANNGAVEAGGAIYAATGTSVHVTGQGLNDNFARFGGAIYSTGTALTLDRCAFNRNWAEVGGGAVACQEVASVDLNRSIFRLNWSDGRGAAVRCVQATPVLRSCSLFDNYAGGDDAGPAIFVSSGGLTLENSIISFAEWGDAVQMIDPGAIEVSCTDIYGNYHGDWTGVLLPFQNINGNISLDPLFCEPWGDGVGLKIDSSSPCMPYSPPNPECDLIGADGVGCPEASVEGWGIGSPGASLRVDPNPFDRETRIAWTVPLGGGDDPIRVTIVDLSGRQVRELHAAPIVGGAAEVVWDGTNEVGAPVAGGVYFARIDSRVGSATRSLILIR